MNRLRLLVRQCERSARVLLGLGLVVGWVAGSAEASPIRHPGWRAEARVVPYSQQFYRVALQRHRKVNVPYRLRTLHAVNGLLPETPFIQYLRWRRSLKPSRFDLYHPYMGKILETDRIIRSQVLAPPVAHRPPGVDAQPPLFNPRPPGSPALPPGTSVPEPSTALLGLTMLGVVAATRRARRFRKRG